MKKIIFTCPREESAKLRLAIGEAGAGKNGNYSFCSMVSEIDGYFKANYGANPTIGEVGNIEKVGEHKIEVICEDSILEKIISVIKNQHSYETPHIEIYEVNLV